MKSEAIYIAISEMLCDAKDINPDALTRETPLTQLELDSLDYVEMTVLVKRQFGVTLTGELFTANPDITLGGLCDLIAIAQQEETA